ncbi:hypothetical protein [Streptomyces coeruleorubidus]|uniref:hypothetical protein n=1 Tax=Streptomyces coeruleorubidus TaxID=116188 RepID=UPI0033B08CDE
MIRRPAAPPGRLTGTPRHRADAGRHDLALRRDVQDSAEPARTHRQPTADAGRVDLRLIPSRHKITLVELTPATDEPPPWWDEWRPPGREAA